MSNSREGRARRKRAMEVHTTNQHAAAKAKETSQAAYPSRAGPNRQTAPDKPSRSGKRFENRRLRKSSMTSQAQTGAERGEISAMTRNEGPSSFFQPSRSARRKTSSGMALTDRMPWEYIFFRSPRTSIASSFSFPGPAASTTRRACDRTSGAYPEKRSSAPLRTGNPREKMRKNKRIIAGEDRTLPL